MEVKRRFKALMRRLKGEHEFGSGEWLYRQGFLTIGRHSYGSFDVRFYEGDTAKVHIGNFTSIGMGVEMIPGANHRIDTVTTYDLARRWNMPVKEERGTPWTKGDIVIGNDVWIGNGVKILSGVKVGDGAVLAAYSVVTKSIDPFTIVAGNPARVVGRRFDEGTANALMEIAWWEWPDDVIAQREPELSSDEVADFVERYR